MPKGALLSLGRGRCRCKTNSQARECSGLTLEGVLVPTASGAFLNLSFRISILAGFLSNGQAFAFMHLDLFKSVNDTFGYAAGDHVLQ